MQANTTSPRLRVADVAAWLAAIFGVVLLVLLFLSFALETRAPTNTPAAGTASGGSVAYFEFGLTADTLWLASAADPSSRKAVFTAPHAREFGVIPSISPTGRHVVYAALPPSTAAPGPDTPAELWYAPLTAGAEPRLVATGVDLLVEPVWSPDAKRIVYRRSDATSYSLIEMPADGGAERILVMTSSDDALFPIGFSADGATFYHVALNSAGSRLFALETASGTVTTVAQISDGLTRDWALSPDGSQIAYLALTTSPEAISSRAYSIDLATAAIEPLTDLGVSAFGPVWDREGTLVVGTLTPGGEGSFVQVRDGKTSQVLGPEGGFDVPLAYLPGGAYLVRAFEGASASAPGRASLTLIDSDGARHVLSTSDVTFVGWSAR
jgi:Tol biopolymer transport system component